MNKKRWIGRKLSKGNVEAPVCIVNDYISFYGDVNPVEGTLIFNEKTKKIRDKILIMKGGKGSTVGSYIIYQMKKNGVAPSAIICLHAEPIIVAGCILAEIPLMDQVDDTIISSINDGDILKIEENEAIDISSQELKKGKQKN